ncbi:MAG: hypothetical protein ACLP5V_10615 [Candidatus Bathyarchaeia archaeon]
MQNSVGTPTEPNLKNRLREVFDKLSRREDLKPDETKFVTKTILDGLTDRSPDITELLVAFFGGLTIKEPTIDELASMAEAMEATKKFRFRFNVDKPLVTAGGTGGDTAPTINVTTPAVIAAAAAGSYALKSGARAFSSKTGSTDLADCLGINVNVPRDVVESCVEKIKVAVWASEGVYPWMSPLIELGHKGSVSAVMPLLYSLRLMIATALNPFSIRRQVRGVSKPFTEKVATVLSKCGYEKALVVLGHGKTEDVMIDEFSSVGKSVVSELKSDGSINTYTILPEDVGVKRGRIEDVLARSSHVENAAVTAGVLSGSDRSTRRDLILLNAASIIYAADDVKNIRDGFEMACQAVDEGKALEELRKLIALSGGKMEKLESILGSLNMS